MEEGRRTRLREDKATCFAGTSLPVRTSACVRSPSGCLRRRVCGASVAEAPATVLPPLRARARVCLFLRRSVPLPSPPSSPIRGCTYPWLLAVVVGWRRRGERGGERAGQGRAGQGGHDGGGTTSLGLGGYRIRFPWTCEEETGIQIVKEIRGSELLGLQQNPGIPGSVSLTRSRCTVQRGFPRRTCSFPPSLPLPFFDVYVSWSR